MASIAQLQGRLSAPLSGPVSKSGASEKVHNAACLGGFVGFRRQPQCITRSLRWHSSGVASRREGRRNLSVRAADATFGAGAEGGKPETFPRMKVRDPYKRLGIDPEATDEEVQEARNYLMKQYGAHEPSREAIEWAHDKIIALKFKSRKKRGINLKAGLAKKEDPLIPTPQFVKDFVKGIKVPATDVILKRLALYIGFVAWSILQSSEQGPSFQLFVAFATTVYFLKEKTQKWTRSIILSLAALLGGWFVGSVAPVAFSAYIPPTIGPELIAALFAFTFLWAANTFLS